MKNLQPVYFGSKQNVLPQIPPFHLKYRTKNATEFNDDKNVFFANVRIMRHDHELTRVARGIRSVYVNLGIIVTRRKRARI